MNRRNRVSRLRKRSFLAIGVRSNISRFGTASGGLPSLPQQARMAPCPESIDLDELGYCEVLNVPVYLLSNWRPALS
jgi:hypothetical protein